MSAYTYVLYNMARHSYNHYNITAGGLTSMRHFIIVHIANVSGDRRLP